MQNIFGLNQICFVGIMKLISCYWKIKINKVEI